MRAKIGLLSLIFVLSIAPVSAFVQPQLRWELKLPKVQVYLQRIWHSEGLVVCYIDHTKTCVSKDYSLYCIDALTGKKLWEPLTKKSGYKILSCSLAIIGKKLYFLSISGKYIEFVCYDLEKNRQIWKTYFKSARYNAECEVECGGYTDKYYWYYHNEDVNIYNISDGKLVYIAKSKFVKNAVTRDIIFLENQANTNLTCFDLILKKNLWQLDKPKGVVKYSYEREGKTYVNSKEDIDKIQSNTICIETSSGNEIWNNVYDGQTTVFWANCDKVAVCFFEWDKPPKLLLLQADDGKLIWEMKLDSNDFTLECNEKYILARFYYTCKPFQIHIYDMETRKKLFATASNFLSPPITYEDKVFYVDGIGINTGIRYLRRVDPGSGKTVWTLSGEIYDFFRFGKMTLVAEPEKISCWGDPNP
jgi:outer membrane protein assembly factor BamB